MDDVSTLPPQEIPLQRLGHRSNRDRTIAAVNTTRDQWLARRVQLALGLWQRTRGLIGHAPLQAGDALLICPCRGVHTCWMRYPIDVVFVDQAGVVVGCCSELRPWRLSRVYGAASCVLELPPGTISTTGTIPGDTVAFRSAG